MGERFALGVSTPDLGLERFGVPPTTPHRALRWRNAGSVSSADHGAEVPVGGEDEIVPAFLPKRGGFDGHAAAVNLLQLHQDSLPRPERRNPDPAGQPRRPYRRCSRLEMAERRQRQSSIRGPELPGSGRRSEVLRERAQRSDGLTRREHRQTAESANSESRGGGHSQGAERLISGSIVLTKTRIVSQV